MEEKNCVKKKIVTPIVPVNGRPRQLYCLIVWFLLEKVDGVRAYLRGV